MLETYDAIMCFFSSLDLKVANFDAPAGLDF